MTAERGRINFSSWMNPLIGYPISSHQTLKYIHMTNTKWTQNVIAIYLYVWTNMTIIIKKTIEIVYKSKSIAWRLMDRVRGRKI